MNKIRTAAMGFLVFFMCTLLLTFKTDAQVIPLPNAFAHNDYWHKRPLLDAMSNGFTHIEADVYLRRSKLVVAHSLPILKKKHTIEGLYLNPIYNKISGINELSQTPLDTVVLMIDIKSNGTKTYAALRKILSKYKNILSTFENGKVTMRNLTLVLTGHRPMKQLKKEELRYVFADADLRKVNHEVADPEMFTTASCRYSDLVTWKGKGEIPAAEKQNLTALVNKAHLSGAKVRLWAAPENESVWHFLRDCGVDLINTDKLVALKQFFIRNLKNSNQQIARKKTSPELINWHKYLGREPVFSKSLYPSTNTIQLLFSKRIYADSSLLPFPFIHAHCAAGYVPHNRLLHHSVRLSLNSSLAAIFPLQSFSDNLITKKLLNKIHQLLCI